MDDFENLAIIEVIKEDWPEIYIANETWLSQGRLLWPPKKFKSFNQRKFLSLAAASDWLEFTEFNVLQRGIKSIRYANERLNFYCLYDNTLDKIKADAEKQLRRKHPVRYLENHLDYNHVFDELKECSTSTPNVSLTDKQKSVQSVCFLCGSEGSIKCNSCGSKIFCIVCCDLYHKHPLRNTHVQQKIETPSYIPKNIQTPRQVHEAQAQPSTSTCISNLEGTDDQHLFIPLNRVKIKTASHQKPKAKLARKIEPLESIHDRQRDDQNSESPIIPLNPTQKPSQMISESASSKALGWSNLIENKENEGESILTTNQESTLQNLDIISKREKELQELSGNTNDIAENKEQKKQAKTVRGRKDKLMKLAAKSKTDVLSSGSSNTKLMANSGNNKVKTVRKDKLLKSSAKSENPSSGPSNMNPTVDSGDNKIAQKIEFQSILICIICGLMGEVKCDKCNSIILCAKCDITYHNHTLRLGHKRQKLDSHLSIENEMEDDDDKLNKLNNGGLDGALLEESDNLGEFFLANFKRGLANLKVNDKVSIYSITEAARIGYKKANEIVGMIVTDNSSDGYSKLCLMDSIIKNIGDPYTSLINEDLVEVYSKIFENADTSTRKKLYTLRQTWHGVVSKSTLLSLDNALHELDAGWPVVEPSYKEPRPPPRLLKITNKNMSIGSSAAEIDTTGIENNKVNQLETRAGYNVNIRSAFEGGHVKTNIKRNVVTCSSFKSNEIVSDEDREMTPAPNEVLNHVVRTSKHEMQKIEKPPIKHRTVKQAAMRTAKRRPLRNNLNKRLLIQMFTTIKAIKKDNDEFKHDLTLIKRSQVVLRNKLDRAVSEIGMLREILHIKNPKASVPLDASFVLPKMPIDSVRDTQTLDRKCLNDTYCDQLAARFVKFTSTDIKGVKTSVKLIMSHIFTYELLMKYSWTGKSELNSGDEDKERFGSLVGIQLMIKKAATLKLHSTPTVEKTCEEAIKDFVRRASQNYARQNS